MCTRTQRDTLLYMRARIGTKKKGETSLYTTNRVSGRELPCLDLYLLLVLIKTTSAPYHLRSYKSVSVVYEQCMSYGEDTEGAGSKTAQLRELYRMINKLGKLERSLILLWLEKRNHQEIADILGISKSNVAVMVFFHLSRSCYVACFTFSIVSNLHLIQVQFELHERE